MTSAVTFVSPPKKLFFERGSATGHPGPALLPVVQLELRLSESRPGRRSFSASELEQLLLGLVYPEPASLSLGAWHSGY